MILLSFIYHGESVMLPPLFHLPHGPYINSFFLNVSFDMDFVKLFIPEVSNLS